MPRFKVISYKVRRRRFTFSRDSWRCSAFTFRQQSHSLQGQQGLTCFLFDNNKVRKKNPNSLNGRGNMKTIYWGVTFHFCRAKNFFIFSFDRFLVSSSPESNAAIQGWARACSQVILLLRTIQLAEIQLGTKLNICSQHHWVKVQNYLVSLISKELMKSLASCVISSKLSSSNSHCAAVTKARVSASLSPWKGDSPLSLHGEGDNSVITMSFERTPLDGSKCQFKNVATFPAPTPRWF